jgi:hypothetical protein
VLGVTSVASDDEERGRRMMREKKEKNFPHI